MGFREVLASPAIALVLGALIGMGLLLPLAIGFRFRDRTEVGLAIVMGSVLFGMVLAVGLLFTYRAISPDGLIWFGPSLVGGFFVALTVFAARVAIRMLKSEDDTRR